MAGGGGQIVGDRAGYLGHTYQLCLDRWEDIVVGQHGQVGDRRDKQGCEMIVSLPPAWRVEHKQTSDARKQKQYSVIQSIIP